MAAALALHGFEHPLERVESNEVRTRGKPPPPIIRKRVMLKATYSEEDIYETWQLVALVELSPLGKCWYLVSQKRLVSTSRVGESEAISYVLLCVRAERPC